MKKRLLIGMIVGVTVFGSVFAMAATLGGITSSTVGADSTTVASCDTNGVTTAYTTSWDTTDKRYEVTSVTVAAVNDACDGLTLSVSLTDTSGAQIGAGTLAIPTSVATSHAVSLTTAPSASLTLGIHVAIA